MPVMSGIDATIAIRNRGVNTPIIALTANVIKSDLDKCIEVGMDDYITKPFDEDAFIEKLSKWILNVENETFAGAGFTLTDELYNLEKLQALARGKNSFIIKMIEMFLYRAPEAMEQIEESFENMNYQDVAFHAHKVKPIFDNLGAPQIMQLLSQIETIAKDGYNVMLIKELIMKINVQLSSILPKLQEDLNRYKSK